MSAASPPAAPVPGATDRAPEVRQMFEALAPRYDLGNRVLSLGLDQRWRRAAVAALGPAAQGEVLDLCAGTMDLTVQLLDAGARHVTALDFSAAMLEAGASKLPPGAPVTRVTADARDLPLPDHSVDGILCGFGLRNVPELPRALAECARVLRPGGVLVVLEFFQPQGLVPRLVQASYNRLVMPTVGGLLTGYGAAYRYLAGSIDSFCTLPQFEALLAAQGLRPGHQRLFPYVAAIAVGRAPEVADA